jgi:hypothetical protein
MKIRPVGAEFYHEDGRTDGRTDGHDEANSRFPKFYELAWKRTNLFFDFISRPIFYIYSQTFSLQIMSE